jgi:hypothetical protein
MGCGELLLGFLDIGYGTATWQYFRRREIFVVVIVDGPTLPVKLLPCEARCPIVVWI